MKFSQQNENHIHFPNNSTIPYLMRKPRIPILGKSDATNENYISRMKLSALNDHFFWKIVPSFPPNRIWHIQVPVTNHPEILITRTITGEFVQDLKAIMGIDAVAEIPDMLQKEADEEFKKLRKKNVYTSNRI